MVDKSVKASSQTCTDGVTSRVLAFRQSRSNQKADKGASTSRQTVKEHSPGKSLGHKSRRTMADDTSEDLSDIEDAEVVGYLHNKKEMLLKKIIWEVLNKEYSKQGRQQQQSTRRKKVTPANKTVKTASKMEAENKKRPSSKINYDVLEELIGEHEETPKRAKQEGIDSDCGDHDDVRPSNEGSNLQADSFEEGNRNGEFENENEYSEEIDGNGECYSSMYPENEYEDEEDGYDWCQ